MQEKLTGFVHWFNALFTSAVLTVNLEATLKILAFLLVTVPLGIVQWWNFLDRRKERQLKLNAPKQSDGG